MDARRKLLVGVNAFEEAEEKPIETLVIDDTVEKEQVRRLRLSRDKRDNESARRTLDTVKRTADKPLPPAV